MMIEYFLPDRCFKSFDKLTPGRLKRLGIKGLILDIDNTIAPYEEAVPTEEAMRWFREMEEAGIRISFVSNNDEARVEIFNRDLGYPHFPNSAKPFGKNIRRAMREMGTTRKTTALMGDQIFTDILAARLAGLKRTFLVPPIKDKTDWLTQSKRFLEKPILKFYRKNKQMLKRQKNRKGTLHAKQS